MKFIKSKEHKTERIHFRVNQEVKNRLQAKANIYCEGNLSRYLVHAGLNYIGGIEDFEQKDPPKGGPSREN